jgi:hypothetical protein
MGEEMAEVWRKDSGGTKTVCAIAIGGEVWWAEIIVTLELRYFSDNGIFFKTPQIYTLEDKDLQQQAQLVKLYIKYGKKASSIPDFVIRGR